MRGIDHLGARFRNADESYVEDRRGGFSWLEDPHLKTFRAAATVIAGVSVLAAAYIVAKVVG